MRIEKIRLRNFRNITDLFLEPNPRVNVLFGDNAQGKTSFLESIFVLTHGKSFRTHDTKQLIQESSENNTFLIDAEIERLGLNHRVILQNSQERKQFVVDNKRSSAPAIQKKFCSVLFSPESLSVIKNSDQERRDLLDDLVVMVYPEHIQTISNFKKLLRQRNKWLKDVSLGTIDSKDVRHYLYFETMTSAFLKTATQVALLRIKALKDLTPDLHAAFRYVTDSSNVDISVDYVISDRVYNELDAEILYAAMYNRWLQLSSAEMAVGHSLVGSHKHDIRILLNGKDSRYYCSQGQQRLLILAFKMAQIKVHYGVHGIYPVLLLDDVLSEIDEKKRVKLLEYMETLETQIFLTSTENTVLSHLSKKDLSVFQVEYGNIKRYESEQGGVSVRKFDHSGKSEEKL
ncbi:MAG: DNA replication and repair protein RecF [Bdellovibrionaceae bacterium]|nr:DNA replication and repair protein RecF [Pseudobdellovibrionaceae bacterium]